MYGQKIDDGAIKIVTKTIADTLPTPSAPPPGPEDTVFKLFHDVLGRGPGIGDVPFGKEYVPNGSYSYDKALPVFVDAARPELADRVEFVYEHTLQRAPDEGAVDYWVENLAAKLAAGVDFEDAYGIFKAKVLDELITSGKVPVGGEYPVSGEAIGHDIVVPVVGMGHAPEPIFG